MLPLFSLVFSLKWLTLFSPEARSAVPSQSLNSLYTHRKLCVTGHYQWASTPDSFHIQNKWHFFKTYAFKASFPLPVIKAHVYCKADFLSNAKQWQISHFFWRLSITATVKISTDFKGNNYSVSLPIFNKVIFLTFNANLKMFTHFHKHLYWKLLALEIIMLFFGVKRGHYHEH